MVDVHALAGGVSPCPTCILSCALGNRAESGNKGAGISDPAAGHECNDTFSCHLYK